MFYPKCHMKRLTLALITLCTPLQFIFPINSTNVSSTVGSWNCQLKAIVAWDNRLIDNAKHMYKYIGKKKKKLMCRKVAKCPPCSPALDMWPPDPHLCSRAGSAPVVPRLQWLRPTYQWQGCTEGTLQPSCTEVFSKQGQSYGLQKNSIIGDPCLI